MSFETSHTGFTDSSSVSDASHADEPAELSLDEAVDFIVDTLDLLQDADEQVAEAASVLQKLAHTIESGDWFGETPADHDDAADMVILGAKTIQLALVDDPQAVAQLQQLHREVLERFGDCLDQDSTASESSCIDFSEPSDDSWSDDDDDEQSESVADDPVAPSAEAISSMLSQIRAEQAEPADQPCEVAAPSCEAGPVVEDCSEDCSEECSEDCPEQLDDELREAFLDDAKGCLAAMEQAMLAFEANPTELSPLDDISRELHTIKGASASIGMNRLASYIHGVEDSIREISESGEPPQPQTLLDFVDAIRSHVDRFRGKPQVATPATTPTTVQPASTDQSATPESAAAMQPTIDFDDDQSDDESVRIKASKLNRLMDMLSELVMLRNERDTELTNLNTINETLVDSVSRLRMLNYDNDGSQQVADIANDIMETSQQLRDCFQPVTDGNNVVSQFIRNFRQELVELRRTPISGLFLRLRRAVSDAARTENKQVKLELIGEQTGIERSLQARVFEPLLHIVRNSVGHGIESPVDRQTAGKPSHGTITLQAHSGPDLLVIEVRDDGGGLDYAAIRRRGLDRGLINANASISEQELAQLIFHPGFSTRESVNQISGRGVGMDVVASTMQRMRGWIEIDSVAGHGTTIRLSLPLPSMIQHAMVFRAGGQLFAVPMQAVQSAGDPNPELNPVSIDQLLDLKRMSRTTPQKMVVLRTGASDLGATNQIAILVDEIVGPEEVVTRPMPRLFKHHNVCAGATLSGFGEIVLLLDVKNLVQIDLSTEDSHRKQQCGPTDNVKVLVVDDSRTARLRVVNSLSRYGVQITQARNGQEAWEMLQRDDFVAVFSDIDMPRMNGIELLREIKQHDQYSETPVVLISSRTEASIHQQVSQWGATACLQKPLTNSALDAALKDMPVALAIQPEPHLGA